MNTILKKHIAAKKNRKKGFTLIEVIVVIAIIAILAAIAVPSLTKYIGSAEKREVQATAHNIQVVLQAEKSENFDVAFPAGPSGLNDTAYNSLTYADVLKANGISLQTTDKLENITWDGNTLQTFKFSNENYSIVYNLATGGFDPVGKAKSTP